MVSEALEKEMSRDTQGRTTTIKDVLQDVLEMSNDVL